MEYQSQAPQSGIISLLIRVWSGLEQSSYKCFTSCFRPLMNNQVPSAVNERGFDRKPRQILLQCMKLHMSKTNTR